VGAFSFVDKVLELKKNEAVTAFYTLKPTEEFLKDHFGDFPVMPGVLMLEALKQTASALAADSEGNPRAHFRLVSAEDIKFGQFVKPGNSVRMTAKLKERSNGRYHFDGRMDLMSETGASAAKAVVASFVLEPLEKI
jgi:3-hydroxyacyl-[acyl-carrier-protein] dehydratase